MPPCTTSPLLKPSMPFQADIRKGPVIPFAQALKGVYAEGTTKSDSITLNEVTLFHFVSLLVLATPLQLPELARLGTLLTDSAAVPACCGGISLTGELWEGNAFTSVWCFADASAVIALSHRA